MILHKFYFFWLAGSYADFFSPAGIGATFGESSRCFAATPCFSFENIKEQIILIDQPISDLS